MKVYQFHVQLSLLAVLAFSFSEYHSSSAHAAELSPEDAEVHGRQVNSRLKRSPAASSNGVKANKANVKVEEKSHWHSLAAESITQKLEAVKIQSNAKNLIFFLGDGMSLSTVTAARIYKGQMAGGSDPNFVGGEEAQLHLDSFPYVGASKTYCSDAQVADSACTATAYLCGVKTNIQTIGVTPTVKFNNCTLSQNPANQVNSILVWAQAAGLSTGIVTTTTVTHASPAGTYAHTANRDWENNAKVEESGQDSNECDDIAEQLVNRSPGNKINVILGGGREHFLDKTYLDLETRTPGARNDSKDLITQWLNNHRKELGGSTSAVSYVTSRDQLLRVNTLGTEYLLGLFAPSHVSYADEQGANNDPSLAEMTKVAIKILSKNPKGFFLFVEGGKIDVAHHMNSARRAIAETIQFDDAIKLADQSTSDLDTLILVTADHSHLLTFSGESERGNPILGFSSSHGADGLPYTTLGYVTGPSAYRAANETTCSTAHGVKSSVAGRVNITQDAPNLYNFNYTQMSYIPMNKSKHAGEDVLIWAKGPWAHLFTGVNEQSFIPHAMAFAACLDSPALTSKGVSRPTGNACGGRGRAGRVRDLNTMSNDQPNSPTHSPSLKKCTSGSSRTTTTSHSSVIKFLMLILSLNVLRVLCLR